MNKFDQEFELPINPKESTQNGLSIKQPISKFLVNFFKVT